MKIRLLIWSVLLCSCSYLPSSFPDSIEKETPEYISLLPASSGTQNPYLIFYPGGLVDPHAYIELLDLMRDVFKQIIIIKPNANLAILDLDQAKGIIEDILSTEENASFVFAGHSLGGVAASRMANEVDDAKGLLLLASYPTQSDNLSNKNLQVLSILGSNDGVFDIQTFEDRKDNLPPGIDIKDILDLPNTIENNSSIYFEIEGGNHSQFGTYGFQEGDNVATITAKDQKRICAEIISHFSIAAGW